MGLPVRWNFLTAFGLSAARSPEGGRVYELDQQSRENRRAPVSNTDDGSGRPSDKVLIGRANVEHLWVKNVQKNPRIKLSVGGEKFEALALPLGDCLRPTLVPNSAAPNETCGCLDGFCSTG